MSWPGKPLETRVMGLGLGGVSWPVTPLETRVRVRVRGCHGL